MSRLRLLLFCLLPASASALAQEAERATGGELPSAAELHPIAREQPFSLPKGYALPRTADLSPWFPPAGDQFGQASCSGWALGYGLATYRWNRLRDQPADTVFLGDPRNVFSPAFIYTLVAQQEGLTDCTMGVSLPDALGTLSGKGAATWAQFPVDTATHQCLRPVPDSVLALAARHRQGVPTLIGNRDLTQWRYHLSQGEPVVFLASIGPFFHAGFRTHGRGPFTWDEPFPMDWSDRTGHIMVCTGYNADSSFTVLNSWGGAWGDRGSVRVPDSTLAWACSEAYVLRAQAVPVAEAPPARVRARALLADNSRRGGLGRAEAHVLEGLQFRALGPVDDGEEQWVEVREAGADAPLHTLLVRQGQPITFHHAGDLHTFTFTGRGLLSGQLRYRLARNAPAQLRLLKEQLDTYDLHGDGVLDGQW